MKKTAFVLRLLLPIIFIVCLTAKVCAQNNRQQRNITSFVTALNNIASHTSYKDWIVTDSFAIEQPFMIDVNDSLCIIIRYFKNGSSYFEKRIAPVAKIKDVWYDDYLGLGFNEFAVRVYRTDLGETTFKLVETRQEFHIGKLGYNESLPAKESLEKLLKKMLRIYK